MLTPLVSVPASRPNSEPEVGGLVTVALAGGKVSGGRIVEELRGGFYHIRLVGLDVPKPYEIGFTLPLSRDKIIDW